MIPLVLTTILLAQSAPATRPASAPTSQPVSESQSLVQRGLQLAARGDHEDAISLFDKAMARDPANASAYAWKASSLLSLGQNKAAEEQIKRALDLDAKTASFHVIMGRVHLASARIDEARDSYDQAARLAPGQAGTFYMDLASSLASVNEAEFYAAIKSALRAAASADPPAPDALFHLGQQAVIEGDQEGREYLQKYLELQQKLPEEQRDATKIRLAKQMIRALDILDSRQ